MVNLISFWQMFHVFINTFQSEFTKFRVIQNISIHAIMNQSTVTAYLMQFIMRKIDNVVSVHFDDIHVEVPNYILLKCI